MNDEDRLREMLTLAQKIERDTATAAEQRRALVLCLRGLVVLARGIDAAPGSILLRRDRVE